MFKQATVNAASIPSTQTNFPVYVDLSRVGITTLAEAQSSRWYEDSAKIVEMPREVVSAAEGHGKYSSLTSTSQLFIDYDGIRADYGVGDTYGRNAVWEDYGFVWHAESIEDATGNASSFTNAGATVSAGKIGGAYDFNNDTLTISNTSSVRGNIADGFTISAWAHPDNLTGGSAFSTSNPRNIVNLDSSVNGAQINYVLRLLGGNINFVYRNSAQTEFVDQITSGGVMATSGFQQVQAVHTGSEIDLYRNGAEQTSTLQSGTVTDASFTVTSGNLEVGNYGGIRFFDGDLDEIRIRFSALSADWITIEYANQNDQATFLGEWTEVASGGTEYTLTCEAGTLMLDAAPSALSIGRTITAEAGTLALAAEPATLGVGRTLSLETGALALTGTAASLAWSTSLVADAGNLSLEAQNAALSLSYSLDAQTLDMTINGAPAAIYAALTQPLEPGSLLLSGEPVDFVVASIINPFCPIPKPFTNSASPFSKMDNPLTDFPKGEC